MLHAFERHFLTALPFLLQNLLIASFLDRSVAYLNKVVILKKALFVLNDVFPFQKLIVRVAR
jgi:hypothetical protein